MKVLYERCAGLDVHKDSVVACMRIHGVPEAQYEVRSFGTTTKALLSLSDWLADRGCTHVAMEATGIYWKPVWHVLEGSFELVLANASHIKNVPGRKTDVNDATWIADLLAHGLIRASFVPPTAIQDVRTLMRTRKQLVRERTRHIQRIQKALEDANIKVASVVSDIMGTSGRAVLRALIEGTTDPEALVAVTTGRLHAGRGTLVEALRGRVRRQHRFLLKLHLNQIEALEKAMEALDEEVEGHLEPFRGRIARLVTMPGIDEVVARVIVSEIGTDMSRFPTAGHLVSWAGLCPRNDESAGKRRSTRLRMGAPWLKATMVQAAWAATRAKGYLRAQFLRLRSRRGPKKALIAVAASMLTAVFYMLRDDIDYRDLGDNYFAGLHKAKAAGRLVQRLRELGYEVTLADAPSLPAKSDEASAVVPISKPGSVESAPVAPVEQNDHAAAGQEKHFVLETVASTATADASPALGRGNQEQVATVAPALAPMVNAGASLPDTVVDRKEPRAATKAKRGRHRRQDRQPPRSADRHKHGGRDPRLPRPGTVLRKHYANAIHEVRVLVDGFEYRGDEYASLSGVARHITGTIWNGFLFFRKELEEVGLQVT